MASNKASKKLIKPSYYTSDIRTNNNIIAYIIERMGLCLVTSEDEIFVIKSLHTPKYGPYPPSELHRITAEELSDIPKLEASLQELAKQKKSWLRPDHIKDINRGIDWLNLDCFIKPEAIFPAV